MKTKFHCLEKWKAITWDRVKSWSNAPDLGISLFVLDHQRVYLLWVVGNVCCFSRWLSQAFQGEPPPSPGLLFREKGTHLRGLFEAVLPSTKQHGVVRARGPQIHSSIHPSIRPSICLTGYFYQPSCWNNANTGPEDRFLVVCNCMISKIW